MPITLKTKKKPYNINKNMPYRALFLFFQEYGISVLITIYRSARNEVLNK